MGLDMYLSKKRYVKRWNHDKKENKFRITVRRGGKKDPTFDADKITHVEEEVKYWRKANHIHKWFVENVQDGVDDCKEYPVYEDKLEELLETCKKVLASTKLVQGKVNNGYSLSKDPVTGEFVRTEHIEDGEIMEDPTTAMELLPTESGFFFGNTDYNKYYWEDVQETVEALEAEKAQGWNGDYYYSASW